LCSNTVERDGHHAFDICRSKHPFIIRGRNGEQLPLLNGAGEFSNAYHSATVLGLFCSATMNTMIFVRWFALGFREMEWTAVGGS
jgi:hypothetical protein